jgi:cytoskeletal protein CcmA (bactofilin family)
MSDTDERMVIEGGAEIEGSLRSTCDVQLDGTIKGELLAPAVEVGPAGSLHGCAKVERFVSRGEISGEIDARHVELSGKVGDQSVIRCKTLNVRLAQPGRHAGVVLGDCQLHVGDKPAERERSATTTQSESEATSEAERTSVRVPIGRAQTKE